MYDPTAELLTKATQGMSLVCDDVREAHKRSDPVMAIILLDLIWDAQTLNAKLSGIEHAYSQSKLKGDTTDA